VSYDNYDDPYSNPYAGDGYGGQQNPVNNAPAGPPAWWDDEQVKKWYREILGREEGDYYGYDHHVPAGSMGAVQSIIENSEEAKARRAAPAPPPAPVTNPSPVTSSGTTNTAAQNFVAGATADAKGYVDTYRNERERVPPYLGFNFTSKAPGAYQSTYTAPTLPTYTAPQQQGTESATMALVDRLLANPHSMSDAGLAGMKEIEKERALSMQGQLLEGQRFDANRRGINFAPVERATNQDFISHLTGAYRDLDLAKIDRDRDDEQGVVQFANAAMDGAANRHNVAFQTDLASKLAQDELMRAQEGFRLQESGSQLANAGFDLSVEQARQADEIAKWESVARGTDSWNATSLASAGLSAQSIAQQLALQEYLENIRQFNASQANQFSMAQFLANQWKR
jgi:hypothetical protein